MAGQDDVRRIALSLPGMYEAADSFGFLVATDRGKDRQVVWAWPQRVHPRKPRVPSAEVVVIRVSDLAEKEALLAREPDKLFTDAHYDGYPAVLARLARSTPNDLEEWITDGWRCMAARRLRDGFDGG